MEINRREIGDIMFNSKKKCAQLAVSLATIRVFSKCYSLHQGVDFLLSEFNLFFLLQTRGIYTMHKQHNRVWPVYGGNWKGWRRKGIGRIFPIHLRLDPMGLDQDCRGMTEKYQNTVNCDLIDVIPLVNISVPISGTLIWHKGKNFTFEKITIHSLRTIAASL